MLWCMWLVLTCINDTSAPMLVVKGEQVHAAICLTSIIWAPNSHVYTINAISISQTWCQLGLV